MTHLSIAPWAIQPLVATFPKTAVNSCLKVPYKMFPYGMILFPPHWIVVIIPLGKLLLYQEMKGVKKKDVRERVKERKKERHSKREQGTIKDREEKKSESLFER